MRASRLCKKQECLSVAWLSSTRFKETVEAVLIEGFRFEVPDVSVSSPRLHVLSHSR
jgi:hypothetical protein